MGTLPSSKSATGTSVLAEGLERFTAGPISRCTARVIGPLSVHAARWSVPMLLRR
jgi:hypothetical protein